MGAIILDGYNRAFVINLAKTLHQAQLDHPLTQAIQSGMRSNSVSAGPLTVAMTVAERHDLPQGYALDKLGNRPGGCPPVAADRRLRNRPSGQEDGGRIRLLRRRKGDGAAAHGRELAARS